jgi:hypothetical protein
VGVCSRAGETSAFDEHGDPLGVISPDGEWPAVAVGVVITPGDVSGVWDAARLRGVGAARQVGFPAP